MTPTDMAQAAMKRLNEFINRSAAQHLRAMRQAWGRPLHPDRSRS